jgi:HigB_toxin, RelE-like toxic component of a toxin-antitoxin system
MKHSATTWYRSIAPFANSEKMANADRGRSHENFRLRSERAASVGTGASGALLNESIGGHDFRLVTRVDFESRIIFTKEVMTHAEYSLRNGMRWKKACGC